MAEKKPEAETGSYTSSTPYSDDQQQVQESSKMIWNEDRLQRAIRILKEMHIQLRKLRTTIPRLLAPLTVQHQTPLILLQEFTKSIRTANIEINQFGRIMVNKEAIQILSQARLSRLENQAGIKSWSVTENPDWHIRNT